MSKIKIKNFGPIKDGYKDSDGWIDVNKVTLFIGNQGSGKSTVAKLITTFMWIEKVLTREDYDKKWFIRKNKLEKRFLTYFRIENYFPKDETQNKTYLEYKGNSFNIKYENGILSINETKNGTYELPQIMYVPAERNFIANVKKQKALNLTSDSLVEFVDEFNNAKEEMKGSVHLPINNVEVEYHKVNDVIYIKGKDYKINLREASSGFQSLVPLYLVTWYLANSVKKQSENSQNLMTSEQRERFRKDTKLIRENDDLTDEQKRIAISDAAKIFNKTSFINIVEEPEQNLYPTSQRQMLNSLLEFNNMTHSNKLILTTHSPFIISYLTLAVKANNLKGIVKNDVLRNKLYGIVPMNSLVNSEDIVIYELDDFGNILKLDDYKGLPSDDNYLNIKLEETNELFTNLLEIEDKCQ